MRDVESKYNFNSSEETGNRPEEDEYWFGIQKFDNAADAFEMMSGVYGDDAEFEDMHSIVIGGNTEFTNKIVDTVVFWYYLVKTGKMSEEVFEAALRMNCTWNSILLTSFNFLIYNEKNECFYANVMESVDEWYVLSDRQWYIYHEIWETYNMDYKLSKIVTILNHGFIEEFEDKNKPIDDSYFSLVWDWVWKRQTKE